MHEPYGQDEPSGQADASGPPGVVIARVVGSGRFARVERGNHLLDLANQLGWWLGSLVVAMYVTTDHDDEERDDFGSSDAVFVKRLSPPHWLTNWLTSASGRLSRCKRRTCKHLPKPRALVQFRPGASQHPSGIPASCRSFGSCVRLRGCPLKTGGEWGGLAHERGEKQQVSATRRYAHRSFTRRSPQV